MLELPKTEQDHLGLEELKRAGEKGAIGIDVPPFNISSAIMAAVTGLSKIPFVQ